jgi:chromatin segregation and condensation protein Rec8/ScpA/Scc1 (kleisin family)
VDEITTQKLKKSLHFEKSGETLSIEITIENVSPQLKKETIVGFLDVLYQKAKAGLICQERFE